MLLGLSIFCAAIWFLWPLQSARQWLFQSGNGNAAEQSYPSKSNGDQYLLGVGKADITGYGNLLL